MRFCFLFFFLSSSLYALNENEWVSRLQAIHVIRDHHFAINETNVALKEFPHSKSILEVAIRLNAKIGDEEKALFLLKKYIKDFSPDEMPRDLIEDIAWGVIEKGSHTSAPLMRAIALIAATMGNDARGVDILAKNLSDSNRVIRMLAVDFASHFRDAKLQDGIIDRFLQEKDPLVRRELIKAIGTMKIEMGEKELLSLLENEKSEAEEKLAAIEALVALKEKVETQEIERLVKSNRSGLRCLACELVRFNQNKEEGELLIPLLKDSNRNVRQAAVYTLGSLRFPDIEEKLKPILEDLRPEIVITAAWAICQSNPILGQKILIPYFKHAKKEVRYFATAALASTGKYGHPLTYQIFMNTNDPYVQLTLAKTLIQERQEVNEGAKAIFELSKQVKERWMEKKFGPFIAIMPSEEEFKEEMANYPEAVNQSIRLSLLNLLAIIKYPGTQEAIKEFLKERTWGITGTAAALLLTEGDDEALALIKNLLDDPSEKVRLQAALILAMWGNDPDALGTLQTLYSSVSRNHRDQILEAIGKVGELDTLPFLLEKLEDPQQKIRMIAASSLLQILYH